MTNLRTRSLLRLACIAAVFAVFAVVLTGCGAGGTGGSGGAGAGGSAGSDASGSAGASGTASTKGGFGSGAQTAQGYYDIAEKSAKATVPDAQFLVVQTPSIATETPTAAWAYLFGSKKSNKIYIVTVTDGTADKPVDMGASSLKAADWAKIPAVKDRWKVDSDVALTKAAATYTERLGTAPPSKYAMGMAAFIPPGSTGIKPFVWSVNFDPEGADSANAKARQIDIDATTGAVLPPAKSK